MEHRLSTSRRLRPNRLIDTHTLACPIGAHQTIFRASLHFVYFYIFFNPHVPTCHGEAVWNVRGMVPVNQLY